MKSSGGNKFNQKIKIVVDKLTNAETLRVGFLENATYPDGTSVAMVAAIQDFGAPRAGIPPRPFFRNMIARRSPQWGSQLTNLLRGRDAKTALNLMGEGVKGHLQQSIIETMEPALSQVTLMLRKMKSEDQSLVVNKRVVAEARRRVEAGESVGKVSTKPLIDTSHMLNSADFEVK